jgi:hypothetical protein
VDGEAIDRATARLEQYWFEEVDARRGRNADERAMVAFALAMPGGLAPSRVIQVYDERARLSNHGKSLLLMALGNVEGDQRSRTRTLLAELGGTAVISAEGTHWEDSVKALWSMNTNVCTTAIVVMALARVDPGNPNLDNAVRWLMTARRDGHWATTQETAWSVLALTDVMAATDELHGRYSWAVELNDQVLDRGQVDQTNVDQAFMVTSPVRDLRTGSGNPLVMSRRGRGKLYYDAELRYYLPAVDLRPLARGIVLGRQYFRVDSATLKPIDEPSTMAKIGDVVQARLTLIAPADLHYVLVEDHLPAGFEAVDTSLRTTTAAAAGPTFEEVPAAGEADRPWWERDWWSYWVQSQLRDEKVALFATELSRGTYEYAYLMRASLAGEFNVLPARAEEMYFPDVFGRSAGGTFSVVP